MLLWYQVFETVTLLRTSRTIRSPSLPTLLLAWLFGSTHVGCQVEPSVRSSEFDVLVLYVIYGSAVVIVCSSSINQLRLCN